MRIYLVLLLTPIYLAQHPHRVLLIFVPIQELIHYFPTAWYDKASKYREGIISKEEYDNWRYHYSMKDSAGITAKVPINFL